MICDVLYRVRVLEEVVVQGGVRVLFCGACSASIQMRSTKGMLTGTACMGPTWTVVMAWGAACTDHPVTRSQRRKCPVWAEVDGYSGRGRRLGASERQLLCCCQGVLLFRCSCLEGSAQMLLILFDAAIFYDHILWSFSYHIVTGRTMWCSHALLHGR